MARVFRLFCLGLIATATALPLGLRAQQAPPELPSGDPSQTLTLTSDVQEANTRTGVVTARGNVVVIYPARKLRATAAQAMYYSRQRRIVMSGNVEVDQEGGNSLKGETVTYLIDEGRFVATPPQNGRVQTVYRVTESEP